MSAFDDINATAQNFSETIMGGAFTYTSPTGALKSGLVGVFNTPAVDFAFEEMSQRQKVSLVCVSGKTQWGAVVPANRGLIAYGSISYSIDSIEGASDAGEPCYSLGLRLLT